MESLCSSCLHVREVTSGTGSKFLLCLLSQENSRFPKYPPQPVFRCDGCKEENQPSSTFTLEILTGTFAVCRLRADEDVPDWATGDVVSITRTPDELSIVCSEENVPENIQSESGWRCLRVAGPLEFSLVGVIASLAGTLAAANISVFVISTFDTDYLLVKNSDLNAAVESLGKSGHAVRGM
jgi:hypothetical protein